MDSLYDDFYQQSLDLQNHAKDVIDDHYNPQAQMLQREMQGVTADFKSRRDPHHMEDRLKAMENHLENVKHQGEAVMSYQDVENLQHQFRRLRERVKTMPHQ